MKTTPPAIQRLARRLITFEAAPEPANGSGGAAVRACAKLRVALAKLVGLAGFRSLLSRALAMAKAEVPSLDAVQVSQDGSLEGLDAIESAQDAEAGVVVVAQLLGLLVIFIGEPLTLRLVRDAWPDAPLDESDRTGEGQS